MSIPLSNTTLRNGIIQRIEQELGFPAAYISGNTNRLLDWVSSINIALDKAFHIIFGADGRWQFDDSNHTTYPILTGDLVDGQRDYSFTADSDSNLILDILRVFIRESATDPYYEIFPVDVQTADESEISQFVDGKNTEGAPYHYDKTATGIFLDPIPDANVSAGIELYVSREGSYFLGDGVAGSNAIEAGFAGLYHEYLVLEPCYRYARANTLLKKQETFKRDYLELEKKIKEFYSRRDKHERKIMRGKCINYI